MEQEIAYNQNSIMREIGRNSYYKYIAPGGKYHDQFMDVLNAISAHGDPLMQCIDIFAFGMICGKREERARKK